jgi:hypothetical protein
MIDIYDKGLSFLPMDQNASANGLAVQAAEFRLTECRCLNATCQK